MGYYCSIKDSNSLKKLVETTRFAYAIEKESKRKIWDDNCTISEPFLCLYLFDSERRGERALFILSDEVDPEMTEKEDVQELIDIAERNMYGFNKKYEKDVELLKEIVPVIAGSGITACILQGGKPDQDSIAKDSVSFAKALIREINKELY